MKEHIFYSLSVVCRQLYYIILAPKHIKMWGVIDLFPFLPTKEHTVYEFSVSQWKKNHFFPLGAYNLEETAMSIFFFFWKDTTHS